MILVISCSCVKVVLIFNHENTNEMYAPWYVNLFQLSQVPWGVSSPQFPNCHRFFPPFQSFQVIRKGARFSHNQVLFNKMKYLKDTFLN